MTVGACIWVEAKHRRNEKLCGIMWLQGSERLWLRVLLTWHKETLTVLQSVANPSQQTWSTFQNGCLGKVLRASVELVPACLEGQW